MEKYRKSHDNGFSRNNYRIPEDEFITRLATNFNGRNKKKKKFQFQRCPDVLKPIYNALNCSISRDVATFLPFRVIIVV